MTPPGERNMENIKVKAIKMTVRYAYNWFWCLGWGEIQKTGLWFKYNSPVHLIWAIKKGKVKVFDVPIVLIDDNHPIFSEDIMNNESEFIFYEKETESQNISSKWSSYLRESLDTFTATRYI